MKKLINNISLKFGLTKTEFSTLVFVLVVFALGLILKNSKVEFTDAPKKVFDYSFQDSLFKALNSGKYKPADSLKIVEKRVDSDQELLDFSNKKKDSKKKNHLTLKESSINLNTADIDILTKLPGIGTKTALKIIQLRNEKNGFKSIEELTEVKGIGHKKLQKIKKFTYLR